MESLGEYLKRERERRGVSLDDIARVTRVRRQHLEALEGDRLDALPPAPFVRGFLTAYARQVGLAPEEVAARYQRAVAASAAWAPRAAAANPGAASGGARRREETPAPSTAPTRAPGFPDTRADAERHAEPARAGHRGVLVLLGLVALGALAVVGSILARPATPPARHVPVAAVSPPAEPPQPVVTEAPGVDPQDPEPLASPPVTRPAEGGPADEVAAPVAPPSVLVATATEEAWVQVAVDGQPPVDVLLRPGEQTSWRGARFDLVVGNAGGVTLALDGVAHPALGAPGQVVRLSLPGPASR